MKIVVATIIETGDDIRCVMIEKLTLDSYKNYNYCLKFD